MNKRYYSIFEILSFILYLTKITNSLKAEEFLDGLVTKDKPKSLKDFSEERLEKFLKNVLEHNEAFSSESEEESEEKMSSRISNLVGLGERKFWHQSTESRESFWDIMVEEYEDFTKFCLKRKPCKWTKDCPRSRR